MPTDHLSAPTPLEEHRKLAQIKDDNSYTMKSRFSPDAEGWNDVLAGVYQRIN